MQRSQIGMDFISVLAMPPVEFVQLAADLGCRRIGIGLAPVVSAELFPKWSMREDAGLRRDMVNALQRCGVRVALGEGFIAWPDKDIRELRADFDALRELGAWKYPCLLARRPARGRMSAWLPASIRLGNC